MKDILIGIDLGSTNVKTMFFNKEGKVLAFSAKEYPVYFPKPGWVEYDPADWWESTKVTIRECLKKTGINPDSIAGISVSGLGCCPVPLDEDGNVLYNALPWSDQRAQVEVDFLIKNCKDLINTASGSYPTTMNTMPHLIWIKNNEPEVYKKLFKYTEASGFIVQRLTGEFILEYASASFVEYGIDIKKLKYSEELIKAMSLDYEKFPKLIANTEQAGIVTNKTAQETGLIEGIPVFCGGNDMPSGAIGGGAIKAGQAFLYTGTGANTTVITDDLFKTSPYLLNCLCINNPKIKLIDGVQGSIGFSLKWFRDTLGGLEKNASSMLNSVLDSFEIMDAEALRTEAGAGGVIYLPFLMGHFSPVLNPYAKGVFFGLGPTTTRAQLIKAVIEGCVFDSYQSLKVILDMGIKIDEIIFVGGPSNSETWCQVVSDVTNRKVITVNVPEAATLGNAVLAGVGVGIYKSFEEAIDKIIRVRKIYHPNENNHKIYTELYPLFIQIYEESLESFEKLAKVKEKFGILK
ncbi:MAG: FGGY family carbohydrate kinase [Actinobacteria bacterium]|nr:FGGY family carbohydrate kinase [Actinomycetota bacterium]